MKIRKHLGAILLTACLSQMLALSATAKDTQPPISKVTNSIASKDDLSAQKELFQVQLEAKKELLQKDIEAQAERIDAFERRIDDQNSRIGDIGSGVDMFGIIAGISGTLITILLVGIGFLGYKTAKNDARETAKQEAEKVALQWFETNHKNLNLRMEELEKRVTHASQTIDVHTKEVAQKSSESQAKMKELEEVLEEKAQAQMQIIQNKMTKDKTTGQFEDQFHADNSAIEQKSEKLKQKPESEYTFTDWNTRAFSAYSEGKLEDAIFYWDRAISSPYIQPIAHAQTLFNKGITLEQLNRSEEAIATYDALITQFGSATELALREQVAKTMNNKGITLVQLNRSEEAIATHDALITQFGSSTELTLWKPVTNAMVNKGVTLGQLNRSEEAIATYDAVITQFGSATELALRESVANAMVNKGVTLSQLNRSEEAIAIYDAVITQFGSATELALREPVASALNGKGFNLLCMAKASWENSDLASELLAKASDACTLAISKNPNDGLANGNLAYISWLKGDAVTAEQHFRTGLTSSTDGGETLYKCTLPDFDIHPIEPDNGFRALVEKLWSEHQAGEQKSDA